MSTSVRHVLVGACGVAISGIVLLGTPQTAHSATSGTTIAAPHDALGCGYDGYVNGQPTYNHCGTESVVIEVDHIFWQYTYACMPRGVHVIPQGGSSWAIIGAEYDGHSCLYTEPVPVVGP